jgi:hypothetical protein
MSRMYHSVDERKIEPVESGPKECMKLETIGKAGLMGADPDLLQEKVASVMGLSAKELRRVFGGKPC